MASIPAFQAGGAGSNPVFRSKAMKISKIEHMAYNTKKCSMYGSPRPKWIVVLARLKTEAPAIHTFLIFIKNYDIIFIES